MSQNGFCSTAVWVGGPVAARSGWKRACSSASGPRYWPRVKAPLAARAPPAPTGVAWPMVDTLSAGGAVTSRSLIATSSHGDPRRRVDADGVEGGEVDEQSRGRRQAGVAVA